MYVTCIDFNDKNLKRIEIDDVVVVVVVGREREVSYRENALISTIKI